MQETSIFFDDWFTGFVEGDGCFSKIQRGTRRSPEFSFRIKQKDSGVLEWIQSQLQDGTIYTEKSGYHTFYLGRRASLERVIPLIASRLKFPRRIHQFEQWVRAFDRHHATEYQRLLKPRTPATLTTAWFSGFFQAEGHFSCDSRQRAKILLRIGCVQNQGEMVFGELQKFLGTGSVRLDRNTVRFIVSNQFGVDSFQRYFQKYPLQGAKRDLQDRWLQTVELRKRSFPSLDEIKRLFPHLS